MFGANLVILVPIYDELSRGQAEFPIILSQNGQNDLEGQGQWPLFSIATESIPWCMFGANLVIPAQIYDELSCGQGQVYGQTDGRTGKKWRNYWGKKITLSIKNIVPKVVRECQENVHKWVSETATQDVKQLWSETLYGSDFPEPDNSITTQRQADMVTQKKITAKPPTIADAVNQAVVTQKEEERKRDENRNNLNIYGVPEKVEKTTRQ